MKQTAFEFAIRLADDIGNIDADSDNKQRVATVNLIRDAVAMRDREQHAALMALLDHAENAVYWGLKQHAADAEEGVCTAKAVPGYIVGLRDAAKQARQALADAKGGK